MNTQPTTSPCLSEGQLVALAQHRLPKREAEALMRHVRQCPLCADALDGARLMDDPDTLPQAAAALRQRIAEQHGHKPRTLRWPSPMQWTAAAASVCLLIGFIAFNWMQQGGEMALQSAPENADRLEEFAAEASDSAMESSESEEAAPFPKQAGEDRPSAGASAKEASAPKASEQASEAMPATPPPAEGQKAKPQEAESVAQKRAGTAVGMPLETRAAKPAADTADAWADGEADLEHGTQAEEEANAASPLPPIQMAPYVHPQFDAGQNALLRQGAEAFNAGRLAEAQGHFEALRQAVPQSQVANYLLGITYLYQERPQEARQCLLAVSKREGEVAFEAVDWTGLLELLRQGNTAEAKRLLQTYTLQEGLIRLR